MGILSRKDKEDEIIGTSARDAFLPKVGVPLISSAGLKFENLDCKKIFSDY